MLLRLLGLLGRPGAGGQVIAVGWERGKDAFYLLVCPFPSGEQ